MLSCSRTSNLAVGLAMLVALALAGLPQVRADGGPLEPAFPSPIDEYLDAIKDIELTEDGEVRISFGGQQRTRLESWRNFNFDSDESDTYLQTRTMLHADLQLGERIRGFAQMKAAFVPFGRDLPGGRRTLDVDTMALQQLFFDVKAIDGDEVTLTLRPGRQELAFGAQRLVSPLDWANTRRTWEGFRADVAWHEWTFTGFVTQFVPVRKYEFNVRDTDDDFFGVHASGPLAADAPLPDLDAYWFARHRQVLDDRRHTLGARLHGDLGETPLDYDLEGAGQVGSSGDDSIRSWFIASELGYRFVDVATRPRVFGGFDYASGDADPADGRDGTFDPLFPLGHAYFGSADMVGRRNVIATHAGVSFRPHESVELTATGHAFWRARRADALYNAGGAAIRAADADAARFVGTELDLHARWQATGQLQISGGYSRFFAGSFIRDTGDASDIDFLYVQLQMTF